jgi:hypothetical protein
MKAKPKICLARKSVVLPVARLVEEECLFIHSWSNLD